MFDPVAFEAAAESADPFALARLEKPGHKLILLHDAAGTGYDFILAIPPSSARFELLPETQECTIDRKAKAGAGHAPLPARLTCGVRSAAGCPAPVDAPDENRVKSE